MKHFTNLPATPDERLETDLSVWQDQLENVKTERGKQHAQEIIDELSAEIAYRNSQRSLHAILRRNT